MEPSTDPLPCSSPLVQRLLDALEIKDKDIRKLTITLEADKLASMRIEYERYANELYIRGTDVLPMETVLREYKLVSEERKPY